MAPAFILVVDEGTTGTRALIVNERSEVVATAYTEFTQFHPGTDRVEHDASEIWLATRGMIRTALERAGITASDLAALGITNQRATTVVWDRATGEPVGPAIVWQDTRTADMISRLSPEWGAKVQARTGWSMAPVYSSLSLGWMMENSPGVAQRAAAGDLAFGTIDSWLVHKLTSGAEHIISASNAAVTGSYDLTKDRWYTEWLDALGVPVSMFPRIVDDSGVVAYTDPAVLGARVPIASMITDQSASLFGQRCLTPGETKCTHGTGTFLDMNVGDKPVISSNGLCTVIGWRREGKTTYGLEGYAAVTGSAVQWLRDGAHLISSSAESELLATSVPDNGGVYFVPALTGLSAPSWDSRARGMIIGISPGTTQAHLVRATLEGIVYSIRDFTEIMKTESGHPLTTVRCDGGASRNNFMMQFQADLLGATVVRPANTEATALGAAYLAGLGVGVWSSPEECFPAGDDTVFTPAMPEAQRSALYADWQRAVERSRDWSHS